MATARTARVPCPHCGQTESRVVDTRITGDGTAVRRRRRCACGQRFTTYERAAPVVRRGPPEAWASPASRVSAACGSD